MNILTRSKEDDKLEYELVLKLPPIYKIQEEELKFGTSRTSNKHSTIHWYTVVHHNEYYT